jgi:hypothetical protein
MTITNMFEMKCLLAKDECTNTITCCEKTLLLTMF